jgi:YgiT-type zinc finger domain-containing protein
MICTACKTGLLKAGTTVIPYVSEKVNILVKDVPAMVCDQCGAWYAEPEILEDVRQIIRNEEESGHLVSVVTMKKAA